MTENSSTREISHSNTDETSYTRDNRERVVSVDRVHEWVSMDLTIDEDDKCDDADSSTVTSDEDSYFAKNLPSPKSGRISLASDTRSASSAPARTGDMIFGSVCKESDASLSFSDDDDEEYRATNFAHSILSNLPRGEFPYTSITRMHSASSLVSDGSDEKPSKRAQSRVQKIPIIALDNGDSFSMRSSNMILPPSVSTSVLYRSNVQRDTAGFDQMSSWARSGPTYGTVEASSKPTLHVAHSKQTTKESGNYATGISALDWPNPGRVSRRPPKARKQRPSESLGSENLWVQETAISMTGGIPEAKENGNDGKTYRLYWQRWVMLAYLALLNLLSDWTCYSVAPIATLTNESFGNIYPDQLVVIFLSANAIATACEPVVLSRMGLKRTIVLGALLLMMGSIIKSGGLPPLVDASLQQGQGEWRVYLGFFLVGLSQPLYQCTPALLSASWFPEDERTLATGIALNANHVGIGFAFIFGTLLVKTSDDIGPYFGLLSILSALAFIGSLIQLDDAPPTPPSNTAKVIRGTFEWSLPKTTALWQSLGKGVTATSSKNLEETPSYGRHSITRGGSFSKFTRRKSASEENGLYSIVHTNQEGGERTEGVEGFGLRVTETGIGESASQQEFVASLDRSLKLHPYESTESPPLNCHIHSPSESIRGPPWEVAQAFDDDDSFGEGYDTGIGVPFLHQPFPRSPQTRQSPSIDDLAEPTLTLTQHSLRIKIRDDQIIMSARACFSRSGFLHAVVAFTVSGIVINTISTFMDYLVRLDGGGQEYVGIVGGAFQFILMISGLVVGSQTDKTRAYYSVTIALLVLGAFALAECGVSLDSNQGGELRWALLAVSLLVGPLQPVATELGVEVSFPLSENTVLVIQQLFANLLSALFIPFFKALRSVGTEGIGESEAYSRPAYTFSFYLLILLHAFATVFFATFNGRYLRHEHELAASEI